MPGSSIKRVVCEDGSGLFFSLDLPFRFFPKSAWLAMSAV
jgi:hypothetical protein